MGKNPPNLVTLLASKASYVLCMSAKQMYINTFEVAYVFAYTMYEKTDDAIVRLSLFVTIEI
jgi:hypothetical protein